MRSLVAFAFALLLTGSLIAQTTQFQDVPNRSGLQIAYNRFTDTSFLMTKRQPADGVAGKGSFLNPRANIRTVEIAAAVAFKGQRPAEPLTEILFAVMPDATTKFGSMSQSLERQGGKGQLYFQPDAEIIALADGERLPLGKIAKTGSLDAFGRYNGSAFAAIPLDSFRKMTAAKKLEMAVGGIELKLTKKHQERLQTLMAEIDARQPESKTSPAPSSEAEKKPCFENGRKIPCP